MTAPRRLVVIGCGSIGVCYLPGALSILRVRYPETAVRVLLTRSALQFVRAPAVSYLGGAEVHTDSWEATGYDSALHVELAEWAEAFLVYPATALFLARMALGIPDTPAQYALMCTDAPVVVAPALPERSVPNRVLREHLARVASRELTSVVFGSRATDPRTGRPRAHPPATIEEAFAEVLRLVGQRPGPEVG
jgi:phosphopantothenoylcysteine decarboxylase/phosphopantothenate--cysteine ligase